MRSIIYCHSNCVLYVCMYVCMYSKMYSMYEFITHSPILLKSHPHTRIHNSESSYIHNSEVVYWHYCVSWPNVNTHREQRAHTIYCCNRRKKSTMYTRWPLGERSLFSQSLHSQAISALVSLYGMRLTIVRPHLKAHEHT